MNTNKTKKAHSALISHYDFENDSEAAVTDLLTDLMHICDEYGLDFENELRKANSHYEAETGPNPGECH